MIEEEKFISIIETISSKLLNLKMEKLRKLKELELSANHFQYINIIDRLKKTTFTDLSEKLKITKPAVTSFINKLLQQKIVIKTQSDQDKRFFYIELTDKGKQIADIYKKALFTFTSKIKSSMTAKEFKQLINLIEKGLKE